MASACGLKDMWREKLNKAFSDARFLYRDAMNDPEVMHWIYYDMRVEELDAAADGPCATLASQAIMYGATLEGEEKFQEYKQCAAH